MGVQICLGGSKKKVRIVRHFFVSSVSLFWLFVPFLLISFLDWGHFVMFAPWLGPLRYFWVSLFHCCRSSNMKIFTMLLNAAGMCNYLDSCL